MSEPDNWLKDAPEPEVSRLEPMPYPLTHIEVPVDELDQLRAAAAELAEIKRVWGMKFRHADHVVSKRNRPNLLPSDLWHSLNLPSRHAASSACRSLLEGR